MKMKTGKNSLLKVLSLILCFVMVLSLCACGSGKSAEKPATSDTPAASNDAKPGSASKCVTLAPEGSEYIYDSITMGTGVFGALQTVAAPVVNQAGCTLVYDNIFKVNTATKEIYSVILEDWYWEDDNTLIMKMKDGIYFSNGEKATAEDLIYSYICHKEVTSAALAEVQFDMEKTGVRDEFTAALCFTQYNTAFFTYNVYLYCKSWAQSVGFESTEWQNPVGSGPYKVVEYVNDDHITFEAREDYWNKENDPVVIKQWVMKYYSDASTMAMDMEVGSIAMCAFTSTDYERFLNEGGEGYDVYAGDAGCVYTFAFGFLENECWYDKRVRQAFECGIPWDEFGEVTLGVIYEKATGFVPSTSPEYQELGGYTYDLEKAKSLLKEAGYDESNPLKLHTVMMDTPFYSKSCEALEYYCSQMGVEFTFELKDIPAAVVDWNTPGGGCELGFSYNNLGSPTQLFVRSLSYVATSDVCQWTFVDDEIFDNLYIECSKETDEAKRIELSKQAQQRLYDECLCIPYAICKYEVAYRPDALPSNIIQAGVLSNEYYNLENMSVASAWK